MFCVFRVESIVYVFVLAILWWCQKQLGPVALSAILFLMNIISTINDHMRYDTIFTSRAVIVTIVE